MALSEEKYKKIFVEYKKLFNEYEFGRSVREANETKRPLKQILAERSYQSPKQLLQIFSDYFKTPLIDLKISSVNANVLRLLPEEFASSNLVVAFDKTNNVVKVACEDPSDIRLRNELQKTLQSKIEFYIASEYTLRRALILYR